MVLWGLCLGLFPHIQSITRVSSPPFLIRAKDTLTRLVYSICDTSMIRLRLLLLPKLGDFSWCIVWERIWPSSLGMVGVC